jgi:hypothetical protein
MSVFELSSSELKDRLGTVTARLVSEACESGLYTSHCYDTADLSDRFIHRYPNGRIELVKVDATTGREEILKN